MAELKKCPFCGGEAELNYYGSESIPFYSVSCKECGCNQETSIHKEAVINAWNIRETEAEIRASVIDEFAEALYKKSTDLKYIGSDDYGMLRFAEVYEIAEELKGGGD